MDRETYLRKFLSQMESCGLVFIATKGDGENDWAVYVNLQDIMILDCMGIEHQIKEVAEWDYSNIMTNGTKIGQTMACTLFPGYADKEYRT